MSAIASPALPSAASGGRAVPLALAASWFAIVGTQFSLNHLAQIQAGIGATGDATSWITTLPIVATFFAFSLSPLLARAVGLRRLFIASALAFGAGAAIAGVAQALPALLVGRIVQGFAGGMFGPIAFVAIFRTWGGPRLALGFALLAFVLLTAVSAAPILSAPIEAAAGWRGLLLVQVPIAALLAIVGRRWLPASPLDAHGHGREWLALTLLGIASSSLVVVFAQGTRLDWFESSLLRSVALLGLVASAAFLVTHRALPAPIIVGAKLLDRRFGLPIALNLLFRASIGSALFLLPMLATLARPEYAVSSFWLLLPQLLVFPLVWRWMHRTDQRAPMALGLLAMAVGLGLISLAGSLQPGLALVGAGQMAFLVPALVIGARSLEPRHGPTATIAFNMATLGGSVVGVGLMSSFVQWQLANGDALLAALDDGFLALATVLALAAPLVVLVGRSAPLASMRSQD